jgi:hypothetical protein
MSEPASPNSLFIFMLDLRFLKTLIDNSFSREDTDSANFSTIPRFQKNSWMFGLAKIR